MIMLSQCFAGSGAKNIPPPKSISNEADSFVHPKPKVSQLAPARRHEFEGPNIVTSEQEAFFEIGEDIAMSQPQGPYPPYQPPPNLRPAKSRTTTNPTRIILIIAIVAVAVAGGLLALAYYNDGYSASRFHNSNIVNGLITVQPGSYNTYQFTLPSGATSITISGTFTASGGSGNDIVVMVMDETNYVNWQNGHQSSTFYNSGQVTTGAISASLPSTGTYYLVYSNNFSTLSSKNVQTKVDFGYYG